MDMTRLRDAFRYSRDKMTPFRQRRMNAIKAFLGGNYGDAAGERAHPVNLLEMAVGIYRRNLAARRPTVDIRSKTKKNRVTAKRAELMLNQILEEMRFEDSLSKVVNEALFSIGIMKVGLTSRRLNEAHGIYHDSGLPFADTIDLDDFVFDMRATTWETVQFVGNRFVIPMEVAMESDMYDFGDRQVSESRVSPYNEYGDAKVGTLSRTSEAVYEESRLTPMLEMWEMFFPYENRVVTFCCDEQGIPMFETPIREVNWMGPECGPFHILSLNDVPGQIMPLPPVASLVDLSEAMNRTMRKLVRQNDRSKTIGIVAAGAEDDGERIIAANDGDMIRSDRPEATREIKFGGADQGTLAFALQLRDLFNYMGGNLDTIGGLSSVADTLGQEELIKASSSQKIQDMQARVTKFTQEVTKAIGLWAWYDPAQTYKLVEDLGGTGIEVEIDLKPKDRKESDYFDLNMTITPGSLQETNSAERAQTLGTFVTNYVMPMEQGMMQQGLQFDMNAFAAHMSELTGVEEILDMIVPAGSPIDANGVRGIAEQEPGQQQPNSTRREYVRRNIPTGGTRQSRDNQMTQMLMGANPGPGSESMNLPMQGPLG